MDKKEVLIEVKDLKKYFQVGRNQTLKAVDGVNFKIYKGETLGIVGESGCGKTTCGKTVMGLYKATGGEVLFDGVDINKLNKNEKKEFTKRAQIIFQDPYSSLNPRMTVGDIIGEGIDIHKLYTGKERQEKIYELLELVGLNREHALRFPHEFSGGQRQRIGIAKALSLKPEFIVCDEPVSALDVSIQAQILNLIRDLQNELGLTSLFVGHGLGAVRYVSDRIAVMYLGKIVEIADAGEVFMHPVHPYTKALTQAAPVADPGRREEKSAVLTGEVASAVHPPKGCRFHPRCPYAREDCSVSEPMLLPMAEKPDHLVACPYYEGTETA